MLSSSLVRTTQKVLVGEFLCTDPSRRCHHVFWHYHHSDTATGRCKDISYFGLASWRCNKARFPITLTSAILIPPITGITWLGEDANKVVTWSTDQPTKLLVFIIPCTTYTQVAISYENFWLGENFSSSQYFFNSVSKLRLQIFHHEFQRAIYPRTIPKQIIFIIHALKYS